MKRSEPFVVGRRTSKGTTVLVFRGEEKPAIRGPWTVRAVVAPRVAK
ncbi:MAG TPA: hypothetical protein VK966_05300 [Longimicrobiales bacterium]|nr:hypothetical protein [Longimicrobiales bacterium]